MQLVRTLHKLFSSRVGTPPPVYAGKPPRPIPKAPSRPKIELHPLGVEYPTTETLLGEIRIIIDNKEQVDLMCSLSMYGYGPYELCKIAAMLKAANLRLVRNSEDHDIPDSKETEPPVSRCENCIHFSEKTLTGVGTVWHEDLGTCHWHTPEPTWRDSRCSHFTPKGESDATSTQSA